MKSLFTTEDVKNIIQNIFYDDKNNEDILIIDGDGEQNQVAITDYLDTEFYTWKNRIVDTSDLYYNGERVDFEAWINSLNYSLKKIYALVEETDEEIVQSEDIDSVSKQGTITFLCPTDKIKNLEYYMKKIRNNYVGVPQDLVNANGDIVSAFFLFGIMIYDEEPMQTPIGESIVCSLNYSISYLNNANSYNSMKIEISLDGETYENVLLSSATFKVISANKVQPKAQRPDLVGSISSGLSSEKTFTFFDYKMSLYNALSSKFWTLCAVRKNGESLETQDVNIPIYIRVYPDKTASDYYDFDDIVDIWTCNIYNGDFNVINLSTKTRSL